MLVKDIMTSPAVVIDFQTTICDARKLMVEKNISRLPIVNDNKLVGIIVFSDINKSLHVPGFIPEVPVEWIMSRNPVTVEVEADVVDAARLLIENKISGLPVIGEGQVVGILTKTDLLEFLVKVCKASHL